MDGLLFDTERIFQKAWNEIAEKLGYTVDPGLQCRIMGTNGAAMRREILRTYPGVDAEDYIARVNRQVFEEIERDLPEKPGVHEILAWLRENGVKLAVGSATSPERIEKNLNRSAIRPYFDAVVSSSQVAHGKPAPDVFLKAAEDLGLDPSDCFVFEDGVNGARAGIAAGCAVIMIPDLAEPTEDLRQGCAAILPSLNAALQMLQDGQL